MPSPIVLIADAVRAHLAGGTYSQSFTPLRMYVPLTPAENLRSLSVLVVPQGDQRSPATRARFAKETTIQVAVQRRLTQAIKPSSTLAVDAAAMNAETDPLVALCDEIADSFTLGLKLSTATLTGVAYAPLFVPDHLLQDKVFTGVITLTLRTP